MDYGKWCTIEGERYMILEIDEDAHTVKVYYRGNGFTFDRSRVSEISDFMLTDAERAALGYAF